ncbi:hypothetical protein ACLBXX_19580, partial [Microbacterium sp. C23T]
MRVEDGVPASETAVTDEPDDLKITACRFDRRVGRDKIVKLPCGDGCEAGMRVRPIFENSTACTCQMPIFFSVDQFFWLVGVFFGSIHGCQFDI